MGMFKRYIVQPVDLFQECTKALTFRNKLLSLEPQKMMMVSTDRLLYKIKHVS